MVTTAAFFRRWTLCLYLMCVSAMCSPCSSKIIAMVYPQRKTKGLVIKTLIQTITLTIMTLLNFSIWHSLLKYRKNRILSGNLSRNTFKAKNKFHLSFRRTIIFKVKIKLPSLRLAIKSRRKIQTLMKSAVCYLMKIPSLN